MREKQSVMGKESLGLPLLTSLIVHGLAIVLGSFIVRSSTIHRQDIFPITLIDTPQREAPSPRQKVEAANETKTRPLPAKVEKPKKTEAMLRERTPSSPAVIKEDAKAVDTKPLVPPLPEPPAVASNARLEGGGSEAGAGNLFGKGDVGVAPGTGSGGGGSAIAGLGRSSGAPGLPAQGVVMRTNREAKPIQTVRASYPPMALRMGLESDVALKIEIDGEGKVTKAEITKSGGAGFDDEALRAVKQSRFEPAQKDGQNVAAEFTYIYRFRLQR